MLLQQQLQAFAKASMQIAVLRQRFQSSTKKFFAIKVIYKAKVFNFDWVLEISAGCPSICETDGEFWNIHETSLLIN
jgi:hypothetical protein